MFQYRTHCIVPISGAATVPEQGVGTSTMFSNVQDNSLWNSSHIRVFNSGIPPTTRPPPLKISQRFCANIMTDYSHILRGPRTLQSLSRTL